MRSSQSPKTFDFSAGVRNRARIGLRTDVWCNRHCAASRARIRAPGSPRTGSERENFRRFWDPYKVPCWTPPFCLLIGCDGSFGGRPAGPGVPGTGLGDPGTGGGGRGHPKYGGSGPVLGPFGARIRIQLAVQCRLHQKSAPQTDSSPVSCPSGEKQIIDSAAIS